MSTGAKVWLWIIFVLNIITGVLCIPVALLAPLAWISVLLEVVIIVGAAMLLFKQKKMGFYMFCAASIGGLIINLVLGENIVKSVISAILMPLITYLVLRNSWDQLQ